MTLHSKGFDTVLSTMDCFRRPRWTKGNTELMYRKKRSIKCVTISGSGKSSYSVLCIPVSRELDFMLKIGSPLLFINLFYRARLTFSQVEPAYLLILEHILCEVLFSWTRCIHILNWILDNASRKVLFRRIWSFKVISNQSSSKQLPTFFFLQRIQACVALILFLLTVLFSLWYCSILMKRKKKGERFYLFF